MFIQWADLCYRLLIATGQPVLFSTWVKWWPFLLPLIPFFLYFWYCLFTSPCKPTLHNAYKHRQYYILYMRRQEHYVTPESFTVLTKASQHLFKRFLSHCFSNCCSQISLLSDKKKSRPPLSPTLKWQTLLFHFDVVIIYSEREVASEAFHKASFATWSAAAAYWSAKYLFQWRTEWTFLFCGRRLCVPAPLVSLSFQFSGWRLLLQLLPEECVPSTETIQLYHRSKAREALSSVVRKHITKHTHTHTHTHTHAASQHKWRLIRCILLLVSHDLTTLWLGVCVFQGLWLSLGKSYDPSCSIVQGL